MVIKVHRIKPVNILMFVLILLPIYGDSPLSIYFGAAGYSLLTPLSLILILLYIVVKQKIPKNDYAKKLVVLGVWILIVSFIAILIWLVLGNPVEVLNEVLPIKAIKVFLQYMAYVAYVYLLLICLRECQIQEALKNSVIVLFILAVICILEILQMPYAFGSLHFAGVFPYYRVRLLTLESSTTAMMIYVYSGLALFYVMHYKKKILIILVVISLVLLIAFTGSKTLMFSIGITVFLYIAFAFRKLTKRKIFAFAIAGIILITFIVTILPELSASIINDINNYTSIATRSYTVVLSIIIGIVFPMGVGGAMYLVVLQYSMLKFFPVFDKLPIDLNTSEIIWQATNTTDVGVTVKSAIMQYNLYWGVLGTLYLLYTFGKVGKKLRDMNVLYGDFLLSIYAGSIVLLIGAPFFQFEFWLLYTVILAMIEKHERQKKQSVVGRN